MRSPWKILSDLTSRKRVREEKESSEVQHDASDASIEVEQSPKPLESLREQTWDDLIERDRLPDVAPENSQPKSSPAVLPEPNVDGADESKSVVAGADSNQKSPVLAPQPPKRKPSPVKAAPTQTRIGAESTVDKTGPAALQKSQAEDPFLSELGELDDEIQQLRVALASKLQLQNAQLKRMLDRFGSHSSS